MSSLPFNCDWVGSGADDLDDCIRADYPDIKNHNDDAYLTNKKFNTPVLSGVIAGGVTKLIFNESKTINVPIVGSVSPAVGMGFYVMIGTWISEYLEKHNVLWACKVGYRRFGGFELFQPIHAGVVSQGLSYLGGNDLGLDAFFIGAPSSHIGKFIANTIINPSIFYKEQHPGGLVPTPEADKKK